MYRDTCPECGGLKDRRAVTCKKCRRTTFAKLSWETRWQKRKDGRHWTWIWEGDERRTIYRYQWVWIVAHGPVPDGYELHHRNGDCADDRLENLELITAEEHRKLHGASFAEKALKARGLEPITDRDRTCEHCGETFQIKDRKKANRFCSQTCRISSMQTIRVCATCGKEFIGGVDKGRPRKYCSRACSDGRGRAA